jgi:hypothetical protein
VWDFFNDAGTGRPKRHRTDFSYRYITLLPPAVLASFAASIVVGRAWGACDVAFETRATIFYLHFPALVVAYTATLLAVSLLSGPATWQQSFAVTIAVLMIVTVSWSYFALAGLPLRNEFCPDVEPSWWPWLVPPLPGAHP